MEELRQGTTEWNWAQKKRIR